MRRRAAANSNATLIGAVPVGNPQPGVEQGQYVNQPPINSDFVNLAYPQPQVVQGTPYIDPYGMQQQQQMYMNQQQPVIYMDQQQQPMYMNQQQPMYMNQQAPPIYAAKI